MRFKQLAGRAVPCRELVDGALRTGCRRTMWLSALRREPTREGLTDEVVIRALHYVAARLSAPTVVQREYVQTRAQLVADDKRRSGDDGVLERLLPTGNQILVYCDGWPNALKLARLARPQAIPSVSPTPPPQPPGLPVAPAVALFAALNNRWPSYPVLLDSARRCDLRLQNPPSGGKG